MINVRKFPAKAQANYWHSNNVQNIIRDCIGLCIIHQHERPKSQLQCVFLFMEVVGNKNDYRRTLKCTTTMCMWHTSINYMYNTYVKNRKDGPNGFLFASILGCFIMFLEHFVQLMDINCLSNGNNLH